MISYLLGLLKSTSMKYLGSAGAVLIVVVYWYILDKRLESAIEAKKQAENNVVLISAEFDTLFEKYLNLNSRYEDTVKKHATSIARLNTLHKKELQRATRVATINSNIRNVRDEDDGNVSNVLNATLDALRLLE